MSRVFPCVGSSLGLCLLTPHHSLAWGDAVGLSLRTHVLEEDKGPRGRETEVKSGSPSTQSPNTQPLLLA